MQLGSVVGQSGVENGQAVGIEQPPSPHHHHHHHEHHPSVASYYAPAGLINVVGAEQAGAKPVAPVRNFEQYGQPESAGIPSNYKPFGSWGLYIGGNPADGYYTNYYKALSNSVDKQQAGEQPKPTTSQTAAFSPILKQAGSSPYGGDYYPFAYSPSDLNSGSRFSVEPVAHAQVASISPVQAGAQVYGTPSAFEGNYGALSYADSYATKKVGAAYAQKEVSPKEVQLAPSTKGYQSRVYVYPPVASAPVAPLAVQQQNQQHIVAYPVPVGSQIVGSQPGVDGAFNPYGVHAFTRYAVKPTVVSQEQNYYYSVHAPNQMPAYRQQVYSTHPAGAAYYPMSFYGYPMNQLHYSQGSMHNEAHHNSVQPPHIEAASEKSESEDKSANKQQSKA